MGQTRAMRVHEIWQYPVKSMVGQVVPSVEVDEQGLVGDRTWAARDLERGGIRGAKRIAGLMRLSARHLARDGSSPGAEGGVVEITLPDGTTVTTDDPDVDERVSAAVGHRVALEALRPADDLDHYRRGEAYHDDLMVELRTMFGRTDDEPLPDLAAFPPELIEFESPPGTYYDAYPVMVMSTSSLRSLQEAVPDSVVDVRRFRPSLLVDTGDAPGHPERDWVGHRLRVGEVELDVVGGCPRCVMVTRAVGDDLPADPAILRHVVRDLGQDVGVYATVARPGTVAAGDEVTVV
jgi:uncharacterized protein YcbX